MNTHLLFAIMLFSSACTAQIEDSASTSETSPPTNEQSASTSTTPVSFTENIHESLPSDWVDEYGTIKSNLLDLLPLYQTHYTDIIVYAWNDRVDAPYAGVDGGSYISIEDGDERKKRFVLEIPEPEFTYDSYHRYSVIAHEYFHCYQMSISEHMNLPNDAPNAFNIKWIMEGSAALFEGIYIREHYNYDYTSYDQNQVDESVFVSPALFESHDTSRDIDINYSSSIFLILALSKELQNRGYSEADAFTHILKDFLAIHPQDETWEHDFSSFFGLTVDEFYATLPSYSGQTNTELLPSSTLTLEQIFTD